MEPLPSNAIIKALTGISKSQQPAFTKPTPSPTVLSGSIPGQDWQALRGLFLPAYVLQAALKTIIATAYSFHHDEVIRGVTDFCQILSACH